MHSKIPWVSLQHAMHDWCNTHCKNRVKIHLTSSSYESGLYFSCNLTDPKILTINYFNYLGYRCVVQRSAYGFFFSGRVETSKHCSMYINIKCYSDKMMYELARMLKFICIWCIRHECGIHHLLCCYDRKHCYCNFWWFCVWTVAQNIRTGKMQQQIATKKQPNE